ncbi:MAG: EAL domain-containing protein [Acidimicrobiales bacterium]
MTTPDMMEALQALAAEKGMTTELLLEAVANGLESAYKRMQDIVPEIQALEVVIGDDAAGSDEAMIERTSAVDADNRVDARPEVVVGLCGSNDINVQAVGLLASAREACDSAREMGLGSIYVAGSEDERKRQLEQLVAYTEKALERNALKLFGHRILPLSESDVRPAIYLGISAEDRNSKLIPESTFLPALARSAKAAEIDLWAFRSALRWILNHEEQAEEFALIVVPLSAASMKNEDLPNLLMGEFMETPVPPGRICFSLPDAVVVDNAVAAGELISVLNSFGCRFLLNEFGSGQDNYDYIKNVDVDFVVVQTSFISDAQKNPKDFAMAKSINELVHFMGKKTIARQSDSEGSGDTIKDIGIDFLIEHSDTLELENGDMPS